MCRGGSHLYSGDSTCDRDSHVITRCDSTLCFVPLALEVSHEKEEFLFCGAFGSFEHGTVEVSVLCALGVQHPLNMGVAPWLMLGCRHEEAGSARREPLPSIRDEFEDSCGHVLPGFY